MPDQRVDVPGATRLVRPGLALNLGVTGHRPNRLPADVAPIRARLDHVIRRLGEELVALAASSTFAPEARCSG